jgi:hypothetical protein
VYEFASFPFRSDRILSHLPNVESATTRVNGVDVLSFASGAVRELAVPIMPYGGVFVPNV